MYKLFLKRILDIILSLIAIIILSPIMIITAIIIVLQDKGPALFVQGRVGINESAFSVFKFRSMPVNTANVASADAKSLTITPFGKFIRRTSIDELPQLFNILFGDMSVVGPRPPLASQTLLLETRRRLGATACKPGLTGYAQINGYDDMPEDEKGELDGKYASNISFWTDFKIILGTFGYLVKKPPVV